MPNLNYNVPQDVPQDVPQKKGEKSIGNSNIEYDKKWIIKSVQKKSGNDVGDKFQDCKTSHQRYRYCPIYWSWFQWTLGNN